MDAILACEREVDKVDSKFSALRNSVAADVEKLQEKLEKTKNDILDGDPNEEISMADALILTRAIIDTKEGVMKVSEDHRALHSTVSKVGKAIDRNFTADLSPVLSEHAVDTAETAPLINQVVAEHLLRQGRLDIAETLINEAHLSLADADKGPFLDLNAILDSLKRRQLGPALAWAERNKARLAERRSDLEFRLHRMQFVQMLSAYHDGCENVSVRDLVDYSRNFQRFAESHWLDIQKMMGAMLFMKKKNDPSERSPPEGIRPAEVSLSPYAYLFDPMYWTVVSDTFTKEACALLGISAESPMSVCVSAGCKALPALLNIKQVMQQQRHTGLWNIKDELPVEVDVGQNCRYHSIFACPILRQQSTSTNPPMKLVCGHVISRDALTKLSNGNKLKCPYCPVEQSPADARQVTF